ncbi:MAG: sulfotransferase domain-containing protein [Candidatus Dojkabacteria bacterium]
MANSNSKDIVIFSIARSGSTWFGQIISAADLEYIFEPMAFWHFPGFKAGMQEQFPRPHLYLKKGEKTDWAEYFDMAMAGKIRNSGTIRNEENRNLSLPKKVKEGIIRLTGRQTAQQQLIAHYQAKRRRVIKILRANLALEWMLERYDINPVFLIRDPLSTIASQFIYGIESAVHSLTYYFHREQLFNDHLSEFRDLITHSNSQLNRRSYIKYLAILWAIQVYVPQRQGVMKKMHIVEYNKLVEDPRAELEELSKKTGLQLTAKVWEQVERKSFTTLKHSRSKGYDPQNAWKDILTRQDVKVITRILKRFRLNDYLT